MISSRPKGLSFISDMAVEMTDLPDIKISTAAFDFNPAFAEIEAAEDDGGREE